MPKINFTEPLTLLIAVLLFILVVILSRETKKSVITAIMLFVFVVLLIIHTIMYITGNDLTREVLASLNYTIIFDLIFVLVSFISYLWIDDIEAKLKKKKSIDNSLDWFWGKV